MEKKDKFKVCNPAIQKQIEVNFRLFQTVARGKSNVTYCVEWLESSDLTLFEVIFILDPFYKWWFCMKPYLSGKFLKCHCLKGLCHAMFGIFYRWGGIRPPWTLLPARHWLALTCAEIAFCFKLLTTIYGFWNFTSTRREMPCPRTEMEIVSTELLFCGGTKSVCVIVLMRNIHKFLKRYYWAGNVMCPEKQDH